MKVSWIEHKGKKILFADYEGSKTPAEMLAVLDEIAVNVRGSKDRVLVLDNFTGTYAFKEFMDKVKVLGKELFNEKVIKTGLLGVLPVQKLFISIYSMFTGDKNIKVFDKKEDALDWLVS